PLSPTASASRSDFLTRLNTWPAHSLVNASTPPSRAAPHDSGPMWVATSHSYDSFIHYTSPVLTGAQGVATMKSIVALGVLAMAASSFAWGQMSGEKSAPQGKLEQAPI